MMTFGAVSKEKSFIDGQCFIKLHANTTCHSHGFSQIITTNMANRATMQSKEISNQERNAKQPSKTLRASKPVHVQQLSKMTADCSHPVNSD